MISAALLLELLSDVYVSIVYFRLTCHQCLGFSMHFYSTFRSSFFGLLMPVDFSRFAMDFCRVSVFSDWCVWISGRFHQLRSPASIWHAPLLPVSVAPGTPRKLRKNVRIKRRSRQQQAAGDSSKHTQAAASSRRQAAAGISSSRFCQLPLASEDCLDFCSISTDDCPIPMVPVGFPMISVLFASISLDFHRFWTVPIYFLRLLNILVVFLCMSSDFGPIPMGVIEFPTSSFGFGTLPVAKHARDVLNRPSRKLHESMLLRCLQNL